jgi:hypothetical protein
MPNWIGPAEHTAGRLNSANNTKVIFRRRIIICSSVKVGGR